MSGTFMGDDIDRLNQLGIETPEQLQSAFGNLLDDPDAAEAAFNSLLEQKYKIGEHDITIFPAELGKGTRIQLDDVVYFVPFDRAIAITVTIQGIYQNYIKIIELVPNDRVDQVIDVLRDLLKKFNTQES